MLLYFEPHVHLKHTFCILSFLCDTMKWNGFLPETKTLKKQSHVTITERIACNNITYSLGPNILQSADSVIGPISSTSSIGYGPLLRTLNYKRNIWVLLLCWLDLKHDGIHLTDNWLLWFLIVWSQWIIGLWYRVSEQEAVNKMTLQNLATVFGPTLLRPAHKDTGKLSMAELLSAGARDAMTQIDILRYLLNLKLRGTFGVRL